MEGNDCYKFSTIANYLRATNAKPIQLAMDVGCNLGDVTRQMRSYFLEARVFAFEPVYEYYLCAWKFLGNDPLVRVFQAAITGSHRFHDDVGRSPRPAPQSLQLLRGKPGGGIGWIGGSKVVERRGPDDPLEAYETDSRSVHSITLDEAVAAVRTLTGADEIDYAKFDCEGCEHSALGCASEDTLKRLRFVSGEYHDLRRFYRVMREKLFATHYVNVVGDAIMGSFFAERKGEARTILEPDRAGMLFPRPHLLDEPIDWHPFREEFVHPGERWFHGLEPRR